jgi:hypothetical protein
MKPPHIKAQRRKEIRRIEKRVDELEAKLWNLGYEKLETPIRHGWFKVIKLTPEVERYKNRKAIKEVFDKIKTNYWGATKEKAQMLWDKERAEYMLAKDKPTISRKSFNKLSKKAKDLCVFFRYKDERTGMYKARFYINFPSGCIRIKYARSYITHRKVIDPQLIREVAFLESLFMRKGYYDVYSAIHAWDPWWGTHIAEERKKRERKLKRNLRMLNRESIEDLIKDNVSWEIN